MANPMGHRARCSACGAEAIVTAPGEGTLECCGLPMQDAGAPRRQGSTEPAPQGPAGSG